MPSTDSHDGQIQNQSPAALPAVSAGQATLFQAGDIIGGSYEILGPIGRGAMGMVYRAKHVSMPAEYALKILTDDKLNDVSVLRFQNEAQAIAKLNHPNIVAIYNFGLHEGCLPFYVMDLLAGEDLLCKIDENGLLDVQEALPIFIEACAGLSYAHKKGILHRDIKPANLFILDRADARGARVKVVDFGVVKFAEELKPEIQKLTAMGMVCGTPSYMSPEQATGQKIDPRSDIYSLGCTLFETLTGKVPYRGRNASETMMMHHSANIPSLTSKADGKVFVEDLELLVAKMLAKAPMNRYQNMEALAQDLKNVLEGKPLGTTQAGIFSSSAIGTATGTIDALPKETSQRPKPATANSASRLAPAAHLPAPEAALARPIKAQTDTQDTAIEPVVGGSPAKLILSSLLAVGAITACTYLLWQALQPANNKVSTGTAALVSSPTDSHQSAEQADRTETPEANQAHTQDSKADLQFDVLEAHAGGTASGPIALGKSRYFSRTVQEGGQTWLEFDFPRTGSGLTLAWIGSSVNDSRRAEGKIRFAGGSRLYLMPLPTTLEAPQFFSKFRPGEIAGLLLTPSYASDKLLERAASIAGIKQLLLGNCSQLTAAIMPTLNKLSDLTVLNAAGLTIDGSQLARAPFWPRLQQLSLARCRNIHPILLKLSGSQNLQVLDVGDTNLTSEDYSCLAKLPTLTALNLSRNKITASDLQKLSRLSRLNRLGVVYSRFDGKVLVDALCRMPAMQQLTLLKGSLKEKDLNELKQKRPDLRLVFLTSEQVQSIGRDIMKDNW